MEPAHLRLAAEACEKSGFWGQSATLESLHVAAYAFQQMIQIQIQMVNVLLHCI
jgi:hypothetical protein